MDKLEQQLADKILNDALNYPDVKTLEKLVECYSNLLYAARTNDSIRTRLPRTRSLDAPVNLSVGITETTPAEVPEAVTTDTPAPPKKRAKRQAKPAEPEPVIGEPTEEPAPEPEAPEQAAPEAPEQAAPEAPEQAAPAAKEELTPAIIAERIKEYRRLNTPYLVAKGIDHKVLLREVLTRFGVGSIPDVPKDKLAEFSAAIDEICQPVV